MADIKPLNQIANKWASVTPQRTGEYQAGIQGSNSWEANAAGAEDNWNAGVQQAAARNAFSSGVREAGNAKWQQNTITKGVTQGRWAQGVQGGESAYQAGFQPYHNVIASTTLPDRMERGNPQNLQRVAVIANALHQRKLQGA